MTRLVAGCMTGTSIDSIDAAVVRIEGTGLGMRATFIRGATRPLGDLAPRLRRLAEQEPMTAGEIAALSREFSLAHVPVLREALAGERADLACIHGQTVFHKPPVSWQMLTPAAISRELACPVVFDLRAADLAAGGQGAPITPIADWVFFRSAAKPTAVINLGGFCNITLLTDAEAPSETSGMDVCPCNHLLDAIARKLFFAEYDADGARAARGTIHTEALEDLDGVLVALRGRGRSMGTGDETGEWLSRWRGHVPADDLAASACEAIGSAIARETGDAAIALLAGGGVKNRALRSAIESCCSCRVQTTDDAGLPAEYREAACFAVLGALCQDRVPITLPAVTGVPSPAPISGAWVMP